MAEHPLTPEERAARRAQLRRQYRRRRLTALVVVVAGLIGAGALLAGFVFGGDPVPASQQQELGTSTDCEPTGDPPDSQAVVADGPAPDRARRLGLARGKLALRDAFKRWKLRFVGEPAIMLPAMEERIAGRNRVAKLVVLGIGYNSIWERRRRNYSTWARKFDSEAKELLSTLRKKGARQFVWVTLRDARRRMIPHSALWQYDRYAWYFPYVNQRLRRLDAMRDDLVRARWDEISNRTGITYDAIHLNPVGAELMAKTIRTAVLEEGERQTQVVPPPGDCG